MAQAPVGADLGQALDRLRPLPAQIALDLLVRVDVVAELGDFPSVRSRTFVSGERPSASQILSADGWPIP